MILHQRSISSALIARSGVAVLLAGDDAIKAGGALNNSPALSSWSISKARYWLLCLFSSHSFYLRPFNRPLAHSRPLAPNRIIMRASTTFLAVAAAAAALVPVHASVPEQTRPWSSRWGGIGPVEHPYIGTTEIHDGDGFAIHPARELAGLSLFQEYLKEHPGAFSQGKRELAHIHPIIGTTVLDARETALPSAIPSLLTWASSLSNDPLCKSHPSLCIVGKRAVPESDIFGKFHPIIGTTVLDAREPEPAVPAQLENWVKTHPLLNGKRAPEPAFNFEQYLKEHPFFKYAMDKREPFSIPQWLKHGPVAMDKREPFNIEWLEHFLKDKNIPQWLEHGPVAMDKREPTLRLSPELLEQLLRAGRMDRREATSDIYGKFHPIIGTTVLPGEKF